MVVLSCTSQKFSSHQSYLFIKTVAISFPDLYRLILNLSICYVIVKGKCSQITKKLPVYNQEKVCFKMNLFCYRINKSYALNNSSQFHIVKTQKLKEEIGEGFFLKEKKSF